MGKNSAIQWTDHTFNGWIGCCKVSDGCKHCYAEVLDARWGHNNWGPASTTTRRKTSAAYWKQPLLWNAAAQAAGRRARVFCASMADVFEDHPQLPPWREELWTLIERTPWLDWLLLTKRSENIARMMPVRWGADPELGIFDDTSLMPANVWAMTSVENQEQADKRIPELLKVPAKVRGLSCEPLLGPVNIWRDVLHGGIHWVIAGGESGHGARPMHPDWARGLRDQCVAAGVAFFFKQHGEHIALDQAAAAGIQVDITEAMNANTIGGGFLRVGKHAAGRLLDEREWNQFPTTD